MKRISVFVSLLVLSGLMLSACAAPAAAPAEQPQSPAATAEQPSAPQAEAPTSAPAPAPASAPSGPQHTAVPADMPAGKGVVLGDQSTLSSANAARAFVGDRFSQGKFERPYNANSMDVYFPHLDIASGNFYIDPTWVYVRVTLVGRDAGNAFPGQYAVELDRDMNGRGDLLVWVDHPSSADWTTDGVQVLLDLNVDVGGENIINADSEGRGDGYETVVFDQGSGKDPDAAWVRLDPADANSLDVAFKTSLLENDDTFLAGLWAATDALDPAMFDLNDHYTHEQAGEANEEFTSFYPIKGLAELDNTCRVGIGFVPSGNEPAVCPGQ